MRSALVSFMAVFVYKVSLRHMSFKAAPLNKNVYLTHLCGTTTTTCLRHVEKDLSMSACLLHSASNLWPLGPGYRCSPHLPTWILVFLDLSFQWVWLGIELFVVGFRVLWSCDQRSAICFVFVTFRAFGLFNSLSSSSCRHHFRFSGRYAETFLSNKSNWFFSLLVNSHVSLP
jgi:hypothetical protein